MANPKPSPHTANSKQQGVQLSHKKPDYKDINPKLRTFILVRKFNRHEISTFHESATQLAPAT